MAAVLGLASAPRGRVLWWTLLVLAGCSGPSSNRERDNREPETPTAHASIAPESPPTTTEVVAEPGDVAAPEAPPTSDVLCPGLDAHAPGQGPSVLLGRGLPEIDLAAVAAVVPQSIGAWTRGEPQPSPAGIAGTASASVTTHFRSGDRTIDVRISDLSRVCLARPGDGVLLRDRALARGPSRAIDLEGWPAILANAAAGTFVHAWVSDRCQVTIGGAPEASLLEVARALDWTALAHACPPAPR